LETGDFDSLGTNTEVASMDRPIEETNIGYRLVLKMGWQTGTGLGRNAQGIVDPIKLDTAIGTLGLGKADEYDSLSEEATKQRKLLDTEVQAIETFEMALAREEKAHKEAKLQQLIAETNSVFYCKLCNKQYTIVSDYEAHLNSYDHHHKARFTEMKQLQNAFKADERQRKELKREEKEMARLMALAAKATTDAQSGASSAPSVSPATASDDVPSNAAPLALSSDRPALSLSLSAGTKRKPIGFSMMSSAKKKK